MEQVFIEILGDLVILLVMVVLIFYITHRDAKRQDFLDARYDKLITKMMDNIGQQQYIFKTEILSEVKELSSTISKVFVGIENVSIGVSQVQQEVFKVTEGVNNVSLGVERIVNEVDRVENEVTKVTKGVKEVSTGVNNVSAGVEKVAEEVTKVTDGVNNISTGVTEVVSSLDAITKRIDQELKKI